MNLNSRGILAVVIVTIFVVLAILVGNFFFTNMLGIDVSKLPPFLKFFVHLCGLAVVAYVAKKFFAK